MLGYCSVKSLALVWAKDYPLPHRLSIDYPWITHKMRRLSTDYPQSIHLFSIEFPQIILCLYIHISSIEQAHIIRRRIHRPFGQGPQSPRQGDLIYIYIYECMYLYMYRGIFVYLYICIYVYMCIYVKICIFVQKYM